MPVILSTFNSILVFQTLHDIKYYPGCQIKKSKCSACSPAECFFIALLKENRYVKKMKKINNFNQLPFFFQRTKND